MQDFAKRPRTLTGLAIGDSLGMPFETKEHTDPVLAAWDGRFQPCPDSHPFCRGLKAGQWTDDTKMALFLTKSMLSARTYSPAGAADSYLEWFRSEDLRGIGTATRTALEALSSGKTWLNSGTPGAEGNGTAMRVAPIGLYMGHHGPAVVAECARLDASITHDSAEAREGSVIVALCVAHLAGGGAREDMIDSVAMSGLVRPSRVLGRLKDVAHYVSQIDGAPPSTAVAIAANVLKTGGHVVQTVPAALFCFLTSSSFAEAVDLAVRAGGDTDTTAAVAGALAGTHYGHQEVLPYLRSLESADLLAHLDNELHAGPRLYMGPP